MLNDECGTVRRVDPDSDVGKPVCLARKPLSPTLGDHIFRVRRDRDARTLTGDDPTRKGRILRRLIARGLVRRRPNLELFGETFGVFTERRLAARTKRTGHRSAPS